MGTASSRVSPDGRAHVLSIGIVPVVRIRRRLVITIYSGYRLHEVVVVSQGSISRHIARVASKCLEVLHS